MFSKFLFYNDRSDYQPQIHKLSNKWDALLLENKHIVSSTRQNKIWNINKSKKLAE